MGIFEALLLGALQGATEFLPVSSSGHLVLAEHLLGIDVHRSELMVFNLLIHVATVLAVIIAYWEDLSNLSLAAIGRAAPVKSPKFGLEMRDIWYTPEQARSIIGWVLAGTIVTGGLYLLLKDLIDPLATNVYAAGAGFLCTSVILTVGQRLGGGEVNIRATGLRRAVLVGVAQTLAILPGISRSGTTIAAGLMTGFGRLDAAKFSFFLALPIILLAFAKEAWEARHEMAWGANAAPYAVGFIASLAVGIWAIRFLLRMLRGKDLWPFVYYTAALGVLTLSLAGLGML